MREVAIVSPVRTAVGGFGGTLKNISASDLGAIVIKEILNRTSLNAERIDEVILGTGYPNGEEPNIGRLSSLKAGLPIETSGYQLDRRCSSGLQSILNAAMLIQTGNADVVIAGGTESMSNVEYYVTDARWGGRLGSMTLHDRLNRARVTIAPEDRFGLIEGGMIETAENVATQYEISREDSDRYALRSHQKAVTATKEGKFKEEIVPVSIPQRKEAPIIFDQDEGPRANTSPEILAKLRPLMKGGQVTPGNASSQNDAASACLVVASDKLDELALEPMGYLVGWASAGVHPAYMGIGPVQACKKLFEKTKLNFNDLDLIELNEAFAAQVLAVLEGWGITLEEIDDIFNVNGSGISLGHPVGATGSRILTTMLYEMKRRDVKYGLETMCVGGGMGVAAIFERRPN